MNDEVDALNYSVNVEVDAPNYSVNVAVDSPNYSVTGMIRPGKDRWRKRDSNPGLPLSRRNVEENEIQVSVVT